MAKRYRCFVHATDPAMPTGKEKVWELYYRTPLGSQMTLSPSLQYVADPGGKRGDSDALVAGLRLHITLD